MKRIFIAFIAIAFAALGTPAFAGGKNKGGNKHSGKSSISIGGGVSFDGSATGGFSGATKTGKAKSQASNENYGQSETTAKNGKVKSSQASGSMSTSSSSAKNNGFAASASGGFGTGFGGGISVGKK